MRAVVTVVTIVTMVTGFAAASLLACGPPPNPPETLRRYPVESMDGVLTRDTVTFDAAESSDGNGSLRIEAAGSVRLYETGDVDLMNSQIIYSAKLRAQDLDGRAYLEMWCNSPGNGEFFSRGLQAPVTGTTGWITQQTPFVVKNEESCDNIKLNVVVEGTGTVWIDDLRLDRIAR